MEIVTDKIHEYSKSQPSHLALAWVNQRGQITTKINYKELSMLINQISAHICDSTSLKTADKAVLLFPNGVNFILTFLACIQMGIIPIPLKYPINEKKFMSLIPILRDCKPDYIISTRSLDTKAICSVPWLEIPEKEFTPEAHVESGSFFKISIQYPEIAFLQFTSGSIQEPKGVMISHDNLIQNLNLIKHHVSQNIKNHIVVSWLPHYHDMGLIGSYLFSLYSGSTGYYMAPTTFMTNPNGFIQLISDTKATSIQCPNAAFDYMCDQWDNRDVNLSSLVSVINAAEPIHNATLHKFYDTFKNAGLRKEALKPTYGLAEATLFVTQTNTTHWVSHEKHVSCGLCPDVDIRIVDPVTHTECAKGIEGEIWLNSKCNALGYYNKKELTEETFRAKIAGFNQHYLRTGDLGFISDDQLFVTGRIKEIIILNGVNIYPQDIERTVEEFPGIQPHGCAAFAWEENFETKVVVVAELKNHQSLDINSLYNFILHHHDIPLFDLVLCPVFSLPKTTSGKLKRLSTKELYKTNKLNILNQTKGKSGVEIYLTDDPNHNTKTFYELGIDSITISQFYCQFTQKINPKFIPHLDPSKLYQIQLTEYFKIMNAASDKDRDQAVLNWMKRLNTKAHHSNKCIKRDAKLQRTLNKKIHSPCAKNEIKNVLVTGGTGFIGAYLCFYLLKMTDYHLFLLVRAQNESEGFQRILNNFKKYNLLHEFNIEEIKARVQILCGDLTKTQFGLSESTWDHLSHNIDCLYHNAAKTHYLMGYDDLKLTNVEGTRTIIDLALCQRIKYIHHISTTFIFGWTLVKKLSEKRRNLSLKHVDFGYSESKWVSEQLIWQAHELGVPIQIYRPAMVTASSDAQYTEEDIVTRGITYILNHQVAIDAQNQISFVPVDKAAQDIVAISLLESPKYLTYHITAEYCNLPMICRYITEKYNYQFTYMNFSNFNQHLQRYSSAKDLIFPLTGFFNAHCNKMDKMHNKRYSRDNYLSALSECFSSKDYSFHETVDFIMQFLQRRKLIFPPDRANT